MRTRDSTGNISKTPVPNMFFNCGWGTGGFKATPGSGNVFAASLAKGEMHPLAAPFSTRIRTSSATLSKSSRSAPVAFHMRKKAWRPAACSRDHWSSSG